jgi:hypothetical protein
LNTETEACSQGDRAAIFTDCHALGNGMLTLWNISANDAWPGAAVIVDQAIAVVSLAVSIQLVCRFVSIDCRY